MSRLTEAELDLGIRARRELCADEFEGLAALPTGRLVYRTRAGVCIGLAYGPPRPQIGSEAARIQSVLLGDADSLQARAVRWVRRILGDGARP